jgi:hypothetical protein
MDKIFFDYILTNIFFMVNVTELKCIVVTWYGDLQLCLIVLYIDPNFVGEFLPQ